MCYFSFNYGAFFSVDLFELRCFLVLPCFRKFSFEDIYRYCPANIRSRTIFFQGTCFAELLKAYSLVLFKICRFDNNCFRSWEGDCVLISVNYKVFFCIKSRAVSYWSNFCYDIYSLIF